MPSRFTPTSFFNPPIGDRVRHAVLAAEVEVVEPVGALLVASRDLVELVLHGRSEAIVDEPTEVLLQQARNREGHPGRHERAALLLDIAAVLNVVMIDE